MSVEVRSTQAKVLVGPNGATVLPVETVVGRLIAAGSGGDGRWALPQFESLLLVGHSYVDAGDVDEGGIGRRRFPGIIQRFLGVPIGQVTNCAEIGSTARYGGWRVFRAFDPGPQRFPYGPRFGAVVLWHGANDAGALADGTWQEPSFKQGFLSELHASRVSATFGFDDPSVVKSGTWTDVLFDDEDQAIQTGRGDGYTKTTTTASTLTITTFDDMGQFCDGVWVHLVFIGGVTGATGEVWLDGEKDGDLDVGLGAAAGTAFGGAVGAVDSLSTRTMYTYRLWVPTEYVPGSETEVLEHEIEIRFGATVGASSVGLRFNGWAIEAAPTAPVVVAPNVCQVADPNFHDGAFADVELHETYKLWHREACRSVQIRPGQADPGVIVVDVDRAWHGRSGEWSAYSNKEFFLADLVHPNEYGSAIAANECVKALARTLASGTIEFDSLAGVRTDGLDPITYPPEVFISEGEPLSILDDFERTPSEQSIGGDVAWVEAQGCHGVDSLGQTYLVHPIGKYQIRDDFTRTSVVELGPVDYDAAEGAHAEWEAENGVWGTSGTTAYCVSGAGHRVATVDLGDEVQFVEGRCTNNTLSSHVGLVLRFSDINNFVAITVNGLAVCAAYKMVGGVLTSLGVVSGVGSRFRAEVGSDNVVRFWNMQTGAFSPTTFTLTDAALLDGAGGTKTGLWVHSSATPSTALAFDAFRTGTHMAPVTKRASGIRSAMYVDEGTPARCIALQLGSYDQDYLVHLQGSSFLARRQDDSNYFYVASTIFGFFVLHKVIAGVDTTVATWWAGYDRGLVIAVKVTAAGVWTMYKNGVLLNRYPGGSGTSVTDNALPAATQFGIQYPHVEGVCKSRFRDYRVGDDVSSIQPRRGDVWWQENGDGSATYRAPYDDGVWPAGIDVSTPDHEHTELTSLRRLVFARFCR